MTTTALSRPSAPTISTNAAQLAMGASVTYQILLIVLIFLRPDLDPSWHTISEWAIGQYGWIMSGAFLISAASYGGLFLMLKSELRGALGRIGLGILLVCVIGATGVGLFTTDPMPPRFPLSTRGTLHVILGTGQLVLLPFAALLINLSLAYKNATWIKARGVLLLTSALPPLGFLSFVLYSVIFLVPLGPGAYGPGVNIGWPPRFAFFTYMVWVVVLGWQAIQCSKQTSGQ